MTAPIPSPPDPLDMPATRRDVLAVLALFARPTITSALAWEHFTVAWRGHETSAPNDGGQT